MKSSILIAFSLILFGGIGVLCTLWGIITFGRGEYLTVIVLLAFSVSFFGLILQFIFVKSGNVAARGAFDGSGTMIRPDRRLETLTWVWATGSVIAMGLFAVFQPLGELDIPVPHEMRFYIPFMSAAGAVMGAPLLYRIFKRGGTKYLHLTPNGFEFAQGSSSPSGEWAEVKDVTDRVPDQPAPAYSAIVMVMSNGQTPALAGASFTPDGTALRDMVRFYWQHPECRVELTDGRALERLRNEQF